jgi:transposase
MTRLYGRSKKGDRVNDYTPDARFERTSVISSIRLDGTQVPFMFKGTLDGELFKAYVKEALSPTLKRGDIVIMDNLPSHKVKGALDPIYEKGAEVVFLPPYSPDLNPIEMSWSKMKSVLRKLKAATYDERVKPSLFEISNINFVLPFDKSCFLQPYLYYLNK